MLRVGQKVTWSDEAHEAGIPAVLRAVPPFTVVHCLSSCEPHDDQEWMWRMVPGAPLPAQVSVEIDGAHRQLSANYLVGCP